MPIENDPALPEDTTAADPQAEEDRAESSEQSEEGSETSEDQGKQAKTEELVEEVEISIDGDEVKPDEEPPKDGKAWAKARIREREQDARIAQLEAEAQARIQPPAATDPGPKPTKESCEWDDDRHELELLAWHKKNDAHQAEKSKAAQEAEVSRRTWEEKKVTIAKAEDELVKRAPEAKASIAKFHAAFVGDRMGKVAAIAHLFGEKAPLIVAALGQDPARLKDLAEEKDLAFFIKKVSKLEDKVQEKKKATTPPPPEKKIGGTGGSSGAVDAQEERLREQAMKNGGDITALRAYKKSRAK